MSWFELLEAQPGKVTKVSPDGKKISVQTGPGQSLELDLDKDPNIDVSRTGNKTSIKLNIDNKNKLKKPGQAKPGQQVSIEEGPDYRLKAQRETMNLSDQAVVELVASLYEKIDNMSEIISNTDPEYFTDLYKRHPNENVNEEEECSACGGTGWDRTVTSDEDERGCDECGGTGKVEVDEAVGEFADPIYDLIDDLGASDNHPVLNDLVRYLDGDTIKDFVADFRRNNDLNHPGEDGDYGDDDKNFESKQVKEEEVSVDNAGNIAGYLATIDEYVEILFKHDDMTPKLKNEIAYRIQNAVDDIRTRELGLKPSLIRAKYNKQIESAQKKRLVDTGLKEGPHDKHIFKAIFMAGGPGSGKSFVAKKMLRGFGLKLINSDTIYEYLMKKQNMDHTDPNTIYSPAGQATRDYAKELIRIQRKNFLDGKLGLVIDGTGRDADKQHRLKKMVEDEGYETKMLFINTSLDVAQERNIKRGKAGERQLPREEVTTMWNAVQNNMMKFQQLFGASNFHILDNSGGLEDPDRAENFNKVENIIRKFLTTEPSNSIAKDWISKNRK